MTGSGESVILMRKSANSAFATEVVSTEELFAVLGSFSLARTTAMLAFDPLVIG